MARGTGSYWGAEELSRGCSSSMSAAEGRFTGPPAHQPADRWTKGWKKGRALPAGLAVPLTPSVGSARCEASCKQQKCVGGPAPASQSSGFGAEDHILITGMCFFFLTVTQ